MNTPLTIGEKIDDLIKKKKSTQAIEAKRMGVAPSLLSDVCNDKREVRTDTLKKLCNNFTVSADWLLGLSEAKSRDEDMQKAVVTTGLSEKAVEVLQAKSKEFPDDLETLSKIIESTPFSDLLSSLRRYAMIGYASRTSIPESISKYIREDQMRAMALIEQRQDSISDLEIRFLALKSNLNLKDISELFLNEARDNISAIAKEICEPTK